MLKSTIHPKHHLGCFSIHLFNWKGEAFWSQQAKALLSATHEGLCLLVTVYFIFSYLLPVYLTTTSSDSDISFFKSINSLPTYCKAFSACLPHIHLILLGSLFPLQNKGGLATFISFIYMMNDWRPSLPLSFHLSFQEYIRTGGYSKSV